MNMMVHMAVEDFVQTIAVMCILVDKQKFINVILMLVVVLHVVLHMVRGNVGSVTSYFRLKENYCNTIMTHIQLLQIVLGIKV